MNQKLLCTVFILAPIIGFILGQGIGDTVCVICNSADDENCLRSPLTMVGSPCTNHTCFTRIENGHVVRGCAESLADNVRTNCSAEISDCQTCIQISARPGIPCNNEPFPAQRLSCHQCQGNVNTTCGQVPNTNPTLCRLFSRNDRCFTRRLGENIIRDCESSNLCPDQRCLFCSGDGCNIVIGESADIPDPNSAVGQKHSLILAFATIFSVFTLKKMF